MRLESEGINASELTTQLIDKLTQQQQSQSVSASTPSSQLPIESQVIRGHDIKPGDFSNDVKFAGSSSDRDQAFEILDQFQQTAETILEKVAFQTLVSTVSF